MDAHEAKKLAQEISIPVPKDMRNMAEIRNKIKCCVARGAGGMTIERRDVTVAIARQLRKESYILQDTPKGLFVKLINIIWDWDRPIRRQYGEHGGSMK